MKKDSWIKLTLTQFKVDRILTIIASDQDILSTDSLSRENSYRRFSVEMYKALSGNEQLRMATRVDFKITTLPVNPDKTSTIEIQDVLSKPLELVRQVDGNLVEVSSGSQDLQFQVGVVDYDVQSSNPKFENFQARKTAEEIFPYYGVGSKKAYIIAYTPQLLRPYKLLIRIKDPTGETREIPEVEKLGDDYFLLIFNDTKDPPGVFEITFFLNGKEHSTQTISIASP